tara:strand:+ start:5053 stop:5298 length:246 start_codon:yes stop_codon:yes gene_type:complete
VIDAIDEKRSMNTIDGIDENDENDRSFCVMIDRSHRSHRHFGISDVDRCRHPGDVGLRCITDHDPPMTPSEWMNACDEMHG